MEGASTGRTYRWACGRSREIRALVELGADDDEAAGRLARAHLLRLRAHGAGGDVGDLDELLDAQDLAGGLGRVAVEDGLHAAVEAERDERAFDVGGEGDGGAAEGDAVVRVGL